MAALSAAAVCMAVAGNRATRSLVVPTLGSIQVNVPESWQDTVENPDGVPYPTFVFKPQSGTVFQVLLTPVATAPNSRISGEAGIRQFVAQIAKEAKTHAVEKDLPIKDLKGPSIVGCYFSATDRAPKPGEYKFMTQGLVQIGALQATFTILANGEGTNAVSETITALEAATFAAGTPSSSTNAVTSSQNSIIRMERQRNAGTL